MAAYETPKVDYTPASNVGPADLNRIELNLLKLIALQNLSGTYSVTTIGTTTWTEGTPITLTFPEALVGIGLKVELRLAEAGQLDSNRRFRMGTSYFTSTILPLLDVQETFVIYPQTRSYTQNTGDGYEWVEVSLVKTDSRVQARFF